MAQQAGFHRDIRQVAKQIGEPLPNRGFFCRSCVEALLHETASCPTTLVRGKGHPGLFHYVHTADLALGLFPCSEHGAESSSTASSPTDFFHCSTLFLFLLLRTLPIFFN